MSDFQIHLDQLYRGPADLLLQLVKDEELQAQEIPVSKLCEGFLRHLQNLAKSDLEDASDFLVIAATLMWLKSNAILPHEAIDLEEELKPGDDLLTRLLEYRRFRAMSQKLGVLAEARAQRFARGGKEEIADAEPDFDLGDISSWTLLENFARLMRETLFDRPHVMKGEGKPIREYARQAVEKLKEWKAAPFSRLFEGMKTKEPVIGYFLALLELAKQGVLAVEQKEPFGEIELVLKEEALAALDWNVLGRSMGEEPAESPVQDRNLNPGVENHG